MGNPVKINAKLESITPFGSGVYRLDFVTERRFTRFRPGQFLHLALDPFDPTEAYWPESRIFSLCSSPRRDRISLVYSVKGAFTRRMESELAEGKSYWLKLPYGDFIIDALVEDDETVVLAAGGTGISPYIPFLANEIDQKSQRTIRLCYGLRTASLSIFDAMLDRCRNELTRFELEVVTEDGSRLEVPNADAPHRAGILDAELLLAYRAEMNRQSYFLSGPPAMIEALRWGLATRGVSEERIHIDEWE